MFKKIGTSIKKIGTAIGLQIAKAEAKVATIAMNKGMVISADNYKISINQKIADADIIITGKNIKIEVKK